MKRKYLIWKKPFRKPEALIDTNRHLLSLLVTSRLPVGSSARLDRYVGLCACCPFCLSTFYFYFTYKQLVLCQMDLLQRGRPEKLKVLEVGAINIQMHSCSFLNVRSIDLNSQHPLIEEIDFFEVLPCRQYDVVVCSMVNHTHCQYLSTTSNPPPLPLTPPPPLSPRPFLLWSARLFSASYLAHYCPIR